MWFTTHLLTLYIITQRRSKVFFDLQKFKLRGGQKHVAALFLRCKYVSIAFIPLVETDLFHKMLPHLFKYLPLVTPITKTWLIHCFFYFFHFTLMHLEIWKLLVLLGDTATIASCFFVKTLMNRSVKHSRFSSTRHTGSPPNVSWIATLMNVSW